MFYDIYIRFYRAKYNKKINFVGLIRNKMIRTRENSVWKLSRNVPMYIRKIDISNTKKTFIKWIEMKNITSLNISGCKWIKSEDIAKLIHLKSLNINRCWHKEMKSEDIAKLTNLTSLMSVVVIIAK